MMFWKVPGALVKPKHNTLLAEKPMFYYTGIVKTSFGPKPAQNIWAAFGQVLTLIKLQPDLVATWLL